MRAMRVISDNIFVDYTQLLTAQPGIYQEGDFIANFHGCARDAARNCESEMKPLMTRWRELRDGERRR